MSNQYNSKCLEWGQILQECWKLQSDNYEKMMRMYDQTIIQLKDTTNQLNKTQANNVQIHKDSIMKETQNFLE